MREGDKEWVIERVQERSREKERKREREILSGVVKPLEFHQAVGLTSEKRLDWGAAGNTRKKKGEEMKIDYRDSAIYQAQAD